MIKSSLALAVAVTFAGAATSFAQSASPPSGGGDTPSAAPAAPLRIDMPRAMPWSASYDIASQRHDEAMARAYHPRRVRLANQLAELINNGDCPGARELVASRRDRMLATRVEDVCSAMQVTSANTR